jgi:hypothetical protein
MVLNLPGMRWYTTNYNINLFHFARAYGKKTSDVLFWVVTVINCPSEMRNVRLAIGSNAASMWWVNGKEVIGIYGDGKLSLTTACQSG